MSLDKELVIKIKLDTSQTKQAGQQTVADQKAVEKQVLETLKASEAAKAQLTSETSRQRISAEKLILTDTQIAEKAKQQLIAETNRERIAAVVKATKVEKDSHEQVKGSLQGLIAQYVGLRAAARAVETVAEAWKKVADNQLTAAKATLDFEKQSRELAALLGKTQPGQVVPSALAFSIKTGLDSRNADDFRRQFEGSLPSGLQKGNITRDVADQLAIESGQMAARQGGSAATRGDLAGILPQFGKVGSAQEGLGQLEAIRIGLTEGRGDDTPLTQSLLHVAGSLVKEKNAKVATLPELAAIVGTMSLSSGAGAADTRTEQLIRGLFGGTKEQQAFMTQNFGVQTEDTAEGPRDTAETAMKKVLPKLREIGKTQDAAAFLTAKGVPQEDARAMVEAAENQSVMFERIDKARKAQDGAAVQAANKAFMKSGLGQANVGENRQLAAEVIRGQKSKDFAAMVALEKAEQNTPELEESTLQQAKDYLGGFFDAPVFATARRPGHPAPANRPVATCR